MFDPNNPHDSLLALCLGSVKTFLSAEEGGLNQASANSIAPSLQDDRGLTHAASQQAPYLGDLVIEDGTSSIHQASSSIFQQFPLPHAQPLSNPKSYTLEGALTPVTRPTHQPDSPCSNPEPPSKKPGGCRRTRQPSYKFKHRELESYRKGGKIARVACDLCRERKQACTRLQSKDALGRTHCL
ncbi:hypothetical protein BC629DRAFT_929448 [Irpex lacteus]|nr:hypothetical protein BC629DRAFT_929448 [Irpex lacteus]